VVYANGEAICVVTCACQKRKRLNLKRTTPVDNVERREGEDPNLSFLCYRRY